MFCACTRPRYQVSIYRTIGPLVCLGKVLFCIHDAMCELVHDMEIIFYLCLTANSTWKSFLKQELCLRNCKLLFSDYHSFSEKISRCCNQLT